MTISSFRGAYGFLSNMYPCTIRLGGVTYNSAEAAFQAVKLEDKSKRFMFSGLSGKEAKALGKQVPLRPDWNNIRLDVMAWIVHEKFKQNPELRKQLVATEGELREQNWWNDRFWGVDTQGYGFNHLGEILMKERTNISLGLS